MRLILLLMALALPSWGAITVACDVADSRCSGGTSITVTNVQNGLSDFGFKVSIGGSGTYTLANNDCAFNWHASPNSTGTAPATLYVFYPNHGSMTPGTNTCHLQFDTGVTLTINEVVAPRYQYPYVSNPSHTPDASLANCTTQVTGQYYPCGDTITSATYSPGGTRAGVGGTQFANVALNGTWQDPNGLGGTFTRIATNCVVQYFTNPAISVDNHWQVCSDLRDNSNYLYENTSGTWAVTAATMPTSCGAGAALWLASNANKFVCILGTTDNIKRYTVGAGPTITLDTTIYTNGVENITNTGETPNTSDDWTGVYSASCRTSVCSMNAQIIAVNISTGDSATFNVSSMIYPLTSIAKVLVANATSGDGYRWVSVEGGNSHIAWFKFRPGIDTTLTEAVPCFGASEPNPTANASNHFAQDGSPSCNSSFVTTGGHSTVARAGSNNYRIMGLQPSVQNPNFLYNVGAMRFESGADANKAAENGGGAYVRFGQGGDPGCGVTVPQICVVTLNQAQNYQATSFKITAITGSSPCTFTTDAAHGYTGGTAILIGGNPGMTISGTTGPAWHLTVASAPTTTSFTVSTTCSGTYLNNTSVTADTKWSKEDNQNNEIAVLRLDTGEVRRLAKAPAVGFSDTWTGAGSYFDDTHKAVTYDGAYIVAALNGGIPDYHTSFWIPTGYDLDANTPSNCFDKNSHCLTATVASGQIDVSVYAMNSGSCTVSAYSSTNYNPNTTASNYVTLTGGGAGSRSGSITGLSDGSPYYLTAVCDSYWYARYPGALTPAAAPSRALGGSLKLGGSAILR